MKSIRLLLTIAICIGSMSLSAQKVAFFVNDKDGNPVKDRILDVNLQIKGGGDVLVDISKEKRTDMFVGYFEEDFSDDLEGKDLDPNTNYYACYELVYLGDTIRGDSILIQKAMQAHSANTADRAGHATTADQATTAIAAETASLAMNALNATNAENADNCNMALTSATSQEALFSYTAAIADSADKAAEAKVAETARTLSPDPALEPGRYNFQAESDGKLSLKAAYSPPTSFGAFSVGNLENPDDGSMVIENLDASGIGVATDDVVEDAGVTYPEISEKELDDMIDEVNSNPTPQGIKNLCGARFRNPATGFNRAIYFDARAGRLYRKVIPNRRTPVFQYINDTYRRNAPNTTRWRYPGRLSVTGDASTGEINFTDGFNNYSFMADEFICARGFVQNSDARIKKNIEEVPNVLDKVMELKPKTYQFINRSETADNQEMGFLAQELEEVFPTMVVDVNFDEFPSSKLKGTQKAVKYMELIPVLTKAIQEQQSIIDDQQEQIDQLKKLVEQLVKAKD